MNSVARLLLVGSLGLAVSLDSTASTIQAFTSQASSGIQSLDRQTVSGPGAIARAETPHDGVGFAAAATSTRAIAVNAQGLGRGPIGVGQFLVSGVQASGRTEIDYILWDNQDDRPLTPAEALGIELSFQFRISGIVFVNPLSLSNGGVNFSASIISNSLDAIGDSVLVTYGPVPPPPGQLFATGYLVSGNPLLQNIANQTYELTHSSTVEGHLEMSLAGSAVNASRTQFDLELEQVGVINGSTPLGGLDIHFVGSNEVISVNRGTVSEPSTLLLAGVALAFVLILGRVSSNSMS